MNRFEYENSIRDLLHAPWLQLASILPEDGELHRFNKLGEALDVSHVNLARYMQAADLRCGKSLPAQRVARNRQRFDTTPASRTVSIAAFIIRCSIEVLSEQPFRCSATKPTCGYCTIPRTIHRRPQDPETRQREAFGVVASSYEPIEIQFSEFRRTAVGSLQIAVQGLYLLGIVEETTSQKSESRKDFPRPAVRASCDLLAVTATSIASAG